MEILNQQVREATKAKFDAELMERITIRYFAQEPSRLILPGGPRGTECTFCKETRQLLEEVKEQSGKIDLLTFDFTADKEISAEYGIDKIPAIAICGAEDYGIRFYGIPSGYEYTSLLEAVVDVSRRRTGLSQKTKDALKAVDRNIHIQVFVTPTCPYCSLAVRLGHQFAFESPFIKADMVESTEFPHLANRFNVYGVPKTIINDTVSFEGAVSEEIFLQNVLKAIPPAPASS